MSEKSRLKDKDEILKSLMPKGKLPASAEAEEKLPEDKNPLDLSKYKLPPIKKKSPETEDIYEEPKASEDTGIKEAKEEPLEEAQAAEPNAGKAKAKAPKKGKAKLQEKDAAKPENTAEPQAPEMPGDFIKELSERFEQQFTQRFDNKAKKEEPQETKEYVLEELTDGTAEKATGFFALEAGSIPVLSENKPEELRVFDEEDRSESFFAREVDVFLDKFGKEVKEDEDKLTESLKDELTEKFLTEREKYLKELGIEKEEAADKPNGEIRRLDYHIQPEMHVNKEDPGFFGKAVTYNPFAQVKAQTEEAYEEPALAAGKKTSEQLLKELMLQTKATEERLGLRGTGNKKESTEKQPKKTGSFTLGKKIAGFFIAAVLVAGAAFWAGTGFGDKKDIEENTDTASVTGGDTTTIYESRNFADSKVPLSDVLVKRGGVTISNAEIKGMLIISDIETESEITLDTVTAGTITIKSSEVTAVNLKNVKTGRILLDNAAKEVLIRIDGDSTIDMLEFKTPGTVRVGELDPGAAGIGDIFINSAGKAQSLKVNLENLNADNVITSGEAVLHTEDTSIMNMSSEGSVYLDGTGKIIDLSAGGEKEQADLSVLIKGVSVTNFNVKSPAGINISANIDRMTAADNIVIGGNGSIGSLVLNERFGYSRILADISGVNISTLITEAQSRIDCRGSGRVNTLICNASTYALGNKVNHLEVKSDDVIYEMEPDKITVLSGIKPPQTKADNPNLDYSILAGGAPASDAVTPCGHPADSGGFTKGDGSKDNPFEIENALQLAHIDLHLSSHYIQTGDIDIAAESAFAQGFTPIGMANAFSGYYNGAGYVIKNLKIEASGENTALFAQNIGTIINAAIESGSIVSKSAGNSTSAGLVGLNFDEGRIYNCYNKAKVSGTALYAGGIVGFNYGGKIKDCYNAAMITGAENAGGIAGANGNNGSIAGSYNAGTIEDTKAAGAIAGSNDAVVANCYYLADTAESGIGKGAGTAVEKTSDELQSAQAAYDLSAGAENSYWAKGSDVSGGYNYPVLVITQEDNFQNLE